MLWVVVTVTVSFAGWFAWLAGRGISLLSGYVKHSPAGVPDTSIGRARLTAASGHGRIHRSEDAGTAGGTITEKPATHCR
jgi:hypothetical protein